jgi:hypothetical protein
MGLGIGADMSTEKGQQKGHSKLQVYIIKIFFFKLKYYLGNVIIQESTTVRLLEIIKAKLSVQRDTRFTLYNSDIISMVPPANDLGQPTR